MQDFVDKHIDRYHITERLDMGGMAVVYKAQDTRLDRVVAIKVIRTKAIPAEFHTPLIRRFEREAKAQARFTHRNIVPVFDYGEVEGSPYLVMAHIPGGTLKARTGQPIHYQQAIRWLIPIADALSYAHSRGVIHRDIKPSNILFDTEDQPILTDFGIAKILETDESTQSGAALGVGTPEYMAPEQWHGKVSEATDQYALGVVLFELLTGEKPYHAETPAAVAILQARESVRSPKSLSPDIPKSLEDLLFKALAKNPEDRFEDMNAFRAALEAQLIIETDQSHKSFEAVSPTPITLSKSTAPDTDSEAETFDNLDPTPIEAIIKTAPSHNNGKSAERSGNKGKRRLSWILVMGGVVLILGLVVTFVFLAVIGFRFVNRTIRDSLDSTTAQPTENALAVSIPTPEATETKLPAISPTENRSFLPASIETSVPTATTNPERLLEIGTTRINPVDGAVMVYVPGGEFLMGSDDQDALEDEKPEHSVYLDAFWIYQHEVTNDEYRMCVQENACDEPKEKTDYEHLYFVSHPVVHVNWNDASDYCTWAGGRLPTEAEWEIAARGTDRGNFPWGHQNYACNLVNYANCVKGTSPVGSYPEGASPYGVLDMAGNVWEWVSDWYEEDYYSQSPYENPTGPESGTFRVLRGGSWGLSWNFLRVSSRSKNLQDFTKDRGGFRCIYDLAP